MVTPLGLHPHGNSLPATGTLGLASNSRFWLGIKGAGTVINTVILAGRRAPG